jgi:hypothetical protein
MSNADEGAHFKEHAHVEQKIWGQSAFANLPHR